MAKTQIRASKQILFDSYTMSGSSTIDMNSNKITSLANPTSAQDAATKAYVDGVSQGLDVKESVRAASTGNLTLSGAQMIDGVSVADDRVLVKDQSSASENGIYVAAAGAWSRAADFDGSASGGADAEDVKGAFFFVEEGAINADNGFVCTNDGAITFGATSISFVQFSGAGSVIAGDGLSKSGNTLAVNVDDSTIEIASDTLRVKDSGITNAKLANSSVTITAGDGLKTGGSVSLGATVQLDIEPADFAGAGLEDDGSDNLRIKALGVTNAMLAGSIASTKIAELNNFDTDGLSEGSSNLYYTDARARASVSVADTNSMDMSYNSSTGEFSADAKVDDSSIEVDGTNGLQVKALGVTNAMLAGSIANAKLANSAVTVTAGDGLKTGGAVSLGGTVQLDIEPADFAGAGLEDDGSDNLRIKAAGVTNAMLSGSIASSKIAELSAFDTGDLAEGSNLYYTDARARASVSVADTNSMDMSYNSTTGQFSADAKVDDSSVEVDASNGLQVKALGVTNAMLAGSIASTKIAELNNFDTDGLSEGSSNLYYTDARARAAMSVADTNSMDMSYNSSTGEFSADAKVDDSSIEIDASNGLQVKALGVTNAMLAGSIANAKLANSAVTITAGDGLKTGGSVALGASVQLDIEPADFAGAGLEDDGSDNLRIKAGGVTNAMLSGSIASSKLAELSAFDTGDLSEGSNLYYTDARARAAVSVADTNSMDMSYNSSTGEFSADAKVDDSSIEIDASNGLQVKALGVTNAMLAGSIANAKLANSAVTVTAGDGLKTGGSVSLGGTVQLDIEPNDFAGAGLEDDGSDNLRIKALGVTNAMLAGSIASSKIAELSAFDTGDLAEGSNLYYTDGRARAAISIADTNSMDLTYNSTTGQLSADAKVDDSSIEIDASNGLQVKALGITNAMLAGSIASTKIAELNNFDTDGLSEGSSNLYYTDARARASVSVADTNSMDMSYNSSTGQFSADAKVDDSSIEIDASNGLQVKALGVTNAMLAGSIADGKLAENYLKVSEFVWNEAPTGSKDGSNRDFALASNPEASKHMVYLNGLLQEEGQDYSLSGSNVVQFALDSIPQSGDKVIVSYLKDSV